MRKNDSISSRRRSAIGASHAALLVLALAAPATGQTLPPVARQANLAGPRFGVTFLSEGVVKKLAGMGAEIGAHTSQFGWQFEKQFFTRGSGATVVTEWVALVGGLEQNLVLPSLSWIVGVRTRDGAEFGIGPNVTPAGTALVLATGMTFRAGALNVPLNVAVVPGRSGTPREHPLRLQPAPAVTGTRGSRQRTRAKVALQNTE